MAKQKEAIENLIKILQKWQKVEDDSIKNTTGIIKKSQNPLVQLVMEIIRQDSAMHRRVQQLIIDHFTKQPISINPDELADFWDMVEEHDEIEKKTINMAEAAMAETKSPIALYLLDYLMTDEKKHDKLLEEMNKIKKSMYPYGGY
jgi:hypothetical protein